MNLSEQALTFGATLPHDGARLEGRVVARQDLDSLTRDSMFALLSAHFVNADRDSFEADLSEKNAAILLEDDDGVLRGFSTMLVYQSRVTGADASIVYSGDTIVHRAWWGSRALPRTWLQAVHQLSRVEADRDLYWLLLTSGYRTYRFLPVFFRRFYPRYDEATSSAVKALLDGLAEERFADGYDAATGIVRFAHPQILTADLLDLPRGRVLDPHVAYFLSRNPGHVRGDELACLARIHDDNLTPAGRRMARTALEHRG